MFSLTPLEKRATLNLYRLSADKIFEVIYIPSYVLGQHYLIQKPVELIRLSVTRANRFGRRLGRHGTVLIVGGLVFFLPDYSCTANGSCRPFFFLVYLKVSRPL